MKELLKSLDESKQLLRNITYWFDEDYVNGEESWVHFVTDVEQTMTPGRVGAKGGAVNMKLPPCIRHFAQPYYGLSQKGAQQEADLYNSLPEFNHVTWVVKSEFDYYTQQRAQLKHVIQALSQLIN